MRSLVVIIACVLVSLLWLTAFSIGAQYYVMMPALAIGGAVVVVGVLTWLPPMRAHLKAKAIDVLIGIALAGVTLAATYLAYPLIRDLFPGVAEDVRSVYRLLPATKLAVPVVLLVVVAEELLWRGALLDALRADHPLASAVVLSSTLYGAAQLGLGVPALAIVGFALGVVWAGTAAVTGRLVAPLVAHAIWTLTVFGAFPLEVP